MNRVIRACAELGEANPIVSIHDQGAGGNGTCSRRSASRSARAEVRNILSGDPTMSVLELWGAEYQENCALLLPDTSALQGICARENCPVLRRQVAATGASSSGRRDGSRPSTSLSLVLRTCRRRRSVGDARPRRAARAAGTSVADALDRVLRLPSVGSKRFLTNKVDRSVTGLIAQQQCVGPLHTPLADVGVIAHTHADVAGAATAVGEQPIKGLLSPAAMARLTVAEAVSNLVFAAVTDLGDVKCSANWMWAAKLEGEAGAMYEACEAMAA